MSTENESEKVETKALSQDAVMPCFFPLWNETSKVLPHINRSCLAIRNFNKICNLYLDNKNNWKDDGYDSKEERNFTDVTHWIYLSDIPLPK